MYPTTPPQISKVNIVLLCLCSLHSSTKQSKLQNTYTLIKDIFFTTLKLQKWTDVSPHMLRSQLFSCIYCFGSNRVQKICLVFPNPITLFNTDMHATLCTIIFNSSKLNDKIIFTKNNINRKMVELMSNFPCKPS